MASGGDIKEGGNGAAVSLVQALSARRAIVRLCERPAYVFQPVLKIMSRKNSLAKPVIKSYRQAGQNRKGPYGSVRPLGWTAIDGVRRQVP